MSRLADPHFEDIYTLSKDIKENCLDMDEPFPTEEIQAASMLMTKYLVTVFEFLAE